MGAALDPKRWGAASAGHDDRGTSRQSMVGLYHDQLYYSDDLIARTYALRALGRWLKPAETAGAGNVQPF